MPFLMSPIREVVPLSAGVHNILFVLVIPFLNFK